MSKIAAKDAVILISGSKFSTYVTAYETEFTVDPLDATGFGDASKNYIPGMATAKISCDTLWDNTVSTGVNAKLGTVGQTGVVTLLPEGNTAGNLALTLPYMQVNYQPSAALTDILQIGSIEFSSYGNNNGLEIGNILQSGSITNTLTGTTYDNAISTSGKYAATLHVWGKTITDTYAIVLQHSTNNSTWTTAGTFSANGTIVLSERLTGVSLNRYRRVTATRTGTGDTFGFTVVLYSI